MFLLNLRDLSFDSSTPLVTFFPSLLICFPMQAVLNSNNYAEPLLPRRQKKKKKDGIEKKKTKRRKKETKKMQIAAFWKTDSISLRLFLFFASSRPPTYSVSTTPSLHTAPIIEEPCPHQDLDCLPTHSVCDPTLVIISLSCLLGSEKGEQFSDFFWSYSL